MNIYRKKFLIEVYQLHIIIIKKLYHKMFKKVCLRYIAIFIFFTFR